MQESLAGNAASYRSLLRELGLLLRNYFIRRLGRDRASDAEDLVQETLMAVHAKRATYDQGLPFTPWIHAIARYKLFDHLRKRGQAALVSIDDVEDLLGSGLDDGSIDARLDTETMLGTLPARSRHLVRQVKLEGRSIAEVAAQAGMSLSAVRVAVHRSLKVLGHRFGGATNRDDDA